MKILLAMIAYCAIFFSSISHSQNSYRLHYVIKSKKLVHTDSRCASRSAKRCAKYSQNCTSTVTTKRCNRYYKACQNQCQKGYKIVYIVPSKKPDKIYCCNDTVKKNTNIEDTIKIKWNGATIVTVNDTIPVVKIGAPVMDNQNALIAIGMSQKRIKCYLSPTPEGVKVDFWSFTNPSSPTGYINSSTPLGDNYFIMPFQKRRTLRDPNLYIKANFNAFAVGVGVTNFRYRQKEDSAVATVSTGLTLSINAGYMWGYSYMSARRTINFSLTAGGFIGMTSASIGSKSVKKPSLWNSADDRINPAISYGANLILSRNNLGIVFSVGFDCNIGPYAKDWIYQNKPWIGIGVNTSLGIF